MASLRALLVAGSTLLGSAALAVSCASGEEGSLGVGGAGQGPAGSTSGAGNGPSTSTFSSTATVGSTGSGPASTVGTGGTGVSSSGPGATVGTGGASSTVGTGGASSGTGGTSASSSTVGTGGTSASSSGSAGCGFGTNNPTCDVCMSANCCSQGAACANDTTCMSCATSTSPPPACFADGAYASYNSCETNACYAQCILSSSSTVGTGSTSASSSSVGTGGTSASSSSVGTGGMATSSASSSSAASSSSSSSTSASSSSSAASSSSSSASSSTSASSSSSSTGGPVCGLGHLVISEIRSRGAGGAADEFIELFNATGAPVTLDATWKIEGRSSTGTSYTGRWTGSGKSVPAWGHYLIAGASYTQAPAADDALSSGITDATSLTLVHGTTTVDAVCYYFGTNPFDATYTCMGTPVLNPHDNTTTTDTDASIERKPGGAAGNCTDTGDNAADFFTEKPATPEDTSSPPTP